MSRAAPEPTLFRGIVVALALSLAGASLLAALTPMLGYSAAVRTVIALLGLAYVTYTLASSAERTGRVTTVVVWAAVALAAWIGEPPVGVYFLLHIGMISLARSLYRYSTALSALADIALSMLAAAFALWAAQRASSPWLALWCFFLVQAFHTWLPVSIGSRPPRGAVDVDGFDRARRAAEAAVRRLAETR